VFHLELKFTDKHREVFEKSTHRLTDILLAQVTFDNISVDRLLSKAKYLKLFGANVRALREAKGLTQAELSARINKDKQSIHRVEGGAINPSVYYLYELSAGLEIDASELLKLKPSTKSVSK